MRLFGFTISAKREQPLTWRGRVNEQQRIMGDELTRLGAELREISKAVEATRRKVYRDQAAEEARSMLSQPPDAALNAPPRSFRTGDMAPG